MISNTSLAENYLTGVKAIMNERANLIIKKRK